MALAISDIYNRPSKENSSHYVFSQDYYDVIATFNNIAEKFPILNKASERNLIEKYRNDRTKLNQLLFCHNIRIVLNLAKKYIKKTSSPADLLMNGAIGLMIAAEKFDIDRNIKFNTYATRWVFKYIVMLFYSKSPITGTNQISLNSTFLNSFDDSGAEAIDYLSDNTDDDTISTSVCNRKGNGLLASIDYVNFNRQSIKTPSRNYEEASNAKIVHDVIDEISSNDLDEDIIYNNLMSNNESISSISAKHNIPMKEVNKRKKQLIADIKLVLANKYNINSLKDII